MIEYDSDIEKYLSSPSESEFIRINEHSLAEDDKTQKNYIAKKQNTVEELSVKKIVKEIEEIFKIKLPQDYVVYMENRKGYTGMINEKYYNVWKLEEIISMNDGYQVQEFFPNLIFFWLKQ